MSPEARQELLAKVERRLEQRLLANILRWRETEALEKLSDLINERPQVRAYPNYNSETAKAELDNLQARVPTLAEHEAAALMVAVESFVTPEDARPLVATRLADTWAFGCDWGAAGAVEIGEGTWGVRYGGEYWGGAWTGPVGLFSVGLDGEAFKWPEDVDSLEARDWLGSSDQYTWITSDGKEHRGWVNLNAAHLYGAWRDVAPHLCAARLSWKHLCEVESGARHAELLGKVATEAFRGDKPDDSARDNLAGETRREVSKLLGLFGEPPNTEEEAEPLATKLDELFAAHLAQFGAQGKELAEIIRKNSKKRQNKPAINRWQLWKTQDGKVPPCIDAIALVLWVDVVKPRLEKKNEEEPARLSMLLAETTALAQISGGRRVLNSDQSPTNDILVEPPQGVALCLPWDGIRVKQPKTDGLIPLRQVFQGSAIRTYLALNILWIDAGLPADGVFPADDDAILELIGTTKHKELKNGHLYERYASKSRKALEEHLKLFQAIRVRIVGNMEAGTGDTLVDEYKDRRNGRRRWHAHSRLIVGHMQTSYIRIPREVCKLETNIVPMALGLCGAIRTKITSHVNLGKSIELTTQELADLSGIDLAAGLRRNGPIYLEEFAEAAIAAGSEGKIGEVTFTGGRGNDRIVTIRPHEKLRHSYQPLIEGHKRRAKAGAQAMVRDARRKK